MYSPTARLLAVLDILQARGDVSGAELASRLEVDGRTIRRYITMLQDMGVPVESTRGRHGSYRLRGGFRLPPLLFTDAEVLAVTLGLLHVRQTGLAGDPAAVEGALAKIERVLPDDLRETARAIASSLTLDIPKVQHMPVHDALATLSQAAHQHRRVWLEHCGAQATSQREVDPYGLVHRQGKTYLAGYCHLRHDIRVFRLDRITSVRLLDTSFSPPPDFDVLEQVMTTITSTPRQWSVEVVLHASLTEATQCVPAGIATLEAHVDGVLLRCQTEDLAWFARVLVWIGMPFRIVEPPELRGQLLQLSSDIAASACRQNGEVTTEPGR